MKTPIGSREKLTNFLRAHTVGHLATLTADKKPHISTVYFYANSMVEIFLVTLEETEKYENIVKNSNVALAVSDEVSLKTVQIQGHVNEILEPSVKMAVLEKLAVLQARNKSGWPPPIIKLDKGRLKVIKIVPSWIRFSDFKDPEKVIQYETT